MNHRKLASLLLALSLVSTVAAVQPGQSHNLSEIYPIDTDFNLSAKDIFNVSELRMRNGLQIDGTAIQDPGNVKILEWDSTNNEIDVRNGDLNLTGNNLTGVGGTECAADEALLGDGTCGATSGGGGSQNLSETLANGNSAGSYDIDLNGNNITSTGKNVTIAKDLKIYGSIWLPEDATANIDNSLADVLAENNSADSLEISDLSDPTDPQDAATKRYVDSTDNTASENDVEADIFDTGDNDQGNLGLNRNSITSVDSISWGRVTVGGSTVETFDSSSYDTANDVVAWGDWGNWTSGSADDMRVTGSGAHSVNAYEGKMVEIQAGNQITSPGVNLQKWDWGGGRIYLSAWTRYEADSNEEFRIQVSTDGGSSWQTVEKVQKPNSGVNDLKTRWQQVTYDITPVVNYNQNFKVRFDALASGTADTLYVDNVRLMHAPSLGRWTGSADHNGISYLGSSVEIPNGNLLMNNNTITDVASPSDPYDAANKQYVDQNDDTIADDQNLKAVLSQGNNAGGYDINMNYGLVRNASSYYLRQSSGGDRFRLNADSSRITLRSVTNNQDLMVLQSGGNIRVKNGNLKLANNSIVSEAGKINIDRGGFNLNVPNTCGGNHRLDADMVWYAQDNTGGCGDDPYIAHYIRNGTTEDTTLEIANPNDGTDNIYLRPGGKVQVGGNLDMNQNQIKSPVIDKRSSDPSSPAVGQIWYRTDLD